MENIPKHPYQFDDTAIDLNMPFDFQYGPDELKDSSEIEIIPVNSDGTQFAKSVVRKVFLTNRSEGGNHWYSARLPDKQ